MSILYKGLKDPNRNFLIVGTDEEAAVIQTELSGQGIASRVQVVSPETLSDTLQELGNAAAVCCASSAVKCVDLSVLSRFCQDNNAQFFFCMPELAALQKNMRVCNVGFLSFLSLQNEPLSHWWNRMLKRFFDLLLSAIFLLIFFPFIYIVAAVIIKRKSAGPVFSIFKEIGSKGKRFERMTFRTADLPAESVLNKNYVKSLPQFLNVFTGSMSVVGLQLLREGGDAVPATCNYAKPGMLNCRFCKNADVWYTQNWSLWLDVKILVKALLNKNKI